MTISHVTKKAFIPPEISKTLISECWSLWIENVIFQRYPPKVINNAGSTSGENLTLTSKKAGADSMLDNAISSSFENFSLNCRKA